MAEQHTPTDREPCPSCGHAVSVTYGPDYRFNPPCSSPKMWTAQCGGDCFNRRMQWTAFTRERAIEMWNNGVRAAIATTKQEPRS